MCSRTDVAFGENRLVRLVRAMHRCIRCNDATLLSERCHCSSMQCTLVRRRLCTEMYVGVAAVARHANAGSEGTVQGQRARAGGGGRVREQGLPSAAISSLDSSARHFARISMFWIAIVSQAVRSSSCAHTRLRAALLRTASHRTAPLRPHGTSMDATTVHLAARAAA